SSRSTSRRTCSGGPRPGGSPGGASFSSAGGARRGRDYRARNAGRAGSTGAPAGAAGRGGRPRAGGGGGGGRARRRGAGGGPRAGGERAGAAAPRRELERAASSLRGKLATDDFDVFLSHSSADKPAVKKVGEQLKAHGLLPWLDEWNLVPGRPWMEAVEQTLRRGKAGAGFFGPRRPRRWAGHRDRTTPWSL